MKAAHIVLIVILVTLAIALAVIACVALWLHLRRPDKKQKSSRVGALAPGDTSSFYVYNMTPLTLYIAYSATTTVPTNVSYASLENNSEWYCDQIDPFSAPLSCYLVPNTVLVYVIGNSQCTTFSYWSSSFGGIDGNYEVNITLSRNFTTAQSLFVQSMNGGPQPAGAPWPNMGIKFLEYNSCEYGVGHLGYGSDEEGPEGAAILLGMGCQADGYGTLNAVNPIYVSITVFNGYLPDPSEFTYETFLSWASAYNLGRNAAWNFELQPNTPLEFPLQPWQTWNYSNQDYELDGDLVILFFYDSTTVGYQSYWTPVTGAVDVSSNSAWKVSDLNNLSQNVGVTLISTTHDVFPQYYNWNFCAGTQCMGDTFMCMARMFSPDGIQIPYFAKSGWLAHNHAYSTYGPAYNAQFPASIYAPYAPTNKNSYLQCCSYSGMLGCYCTEPPLSTNQADILFCTSTVYGMSVVVLNNLKDLTDYIEDSGALKDGELFYDDYALPLLETSGNVVTIDNQQVAIDSLNGPSTLNGLGQAVAGVIALATLVVDLIVQAIEDTNIVDASSNSTSFPNWAQPCAFVAKNNSGIVWSIPDGYNYSSYVYEGYTAYISSCPGIQYNDIGSSISETVQYQIATWWVEQGRSYNVLSSTTPFIVNGTSSVSGTSKSFARYTILEDTTPLCTYYPTSSASLTPGSVTNFTNMSLMLTSGDGTTDPLPYQTLTQTITTLAPQASWSISVGSSPDILVYANTTSTRCAAYCSSSNGSYAQTFQTNGFQFVLVGTFATGLGIYPYTGPNTANYSLINPPVQPMTYLGGGLWTGSFTVVSQSGATYMVYDTTIGDAQIISGFVGGSTPQTNVTFSGGSHPFPGDIFLVSGNAVSSQTQPLPAVFSVMTINYVQNGNNYITFS